MIAVKISPDKAVPPNPAPTEGTVSWLIPGIAPLQPKKFLERYVYLKYHDRRFYGIPSTPPGQRRSDLLLKIIFSLVERHGTN